jgi:hypothetical protein
VSRSEGVSGNAEGAKSGHEDRIAAAVGFWC